MKIFVDNTFHNTYNAFHLFMEEKLSIIKLQ